MAPKNQKKASKEKEEKVVEEVAPAEEAEEAEEAADEVEEEVEEEEAVAKEGEVEGDKPEEDDAKSEVYEKEDAEEKAESVKENGVDADDDAKESSEKKKSPKKKKGKSTKKSGDEADEEEEEPIGLYDNPPEVLDGKRERKSRDFITYTKKDLGKVKWMEHEKEEEPDYSKGEGTALKSIPFIKFQISQEDEEDLLVLYKLMYRKQPKYLNSIKRKIYAFKGYPYDDKSKYYKSHQNLCDRLLLQGVRYINELLGLDRKDKTKDEMIEELLEFLKKPEDKGLEVPKREVVPKKKSKSGRRGRVSKRIKDHKEKKVYVDDESDEESEEESEDEEEEKKSEEESEEEEEEDDGRRKSRRVSSPKKKTPAKTTARVAAKTSAAKKKTPSRGGAKRRASYPSDDSSDEEVLVKVKKSKKSPAKPTAKAAPPPTNPELKKAITTLLKDADLGSITMKNILHQIYDKYSQFDLSDRKDFLKKTVKDCL